MNYRSLSLALALLASCLPAHATAGMMLSRAVVSFLPGEPARQDIIVRNPDKETLYIKVEVSEILDPGTDHETRKVAKEAEDIDLLATPNKMIIPAGEEKVVRLVNLKPNGDRERIFRVLLTPIVGDVQSDLPMAIKVVIAYDTLVIVEPKQARQAFDGKRDGQHITFTNTGNVYTMVDDGHQCPAEGAPESSCAKLPGNRVYPGGSWTLDLPYDQPVEFDVESLQKHERRRFE